MPQLVGKPRRGAGEQVGAAQQLACGLGRRDG